MIWFKRKKEKTVLLQSKDISDKEHIPFDPTIEQVYDPINPPQHMKCIISGNLDSNNERNVYKKRLLRGETDKSAKGGLKHHQEYF